MNTAAPDTIPERTPQPCDLVQLRSRRWLIEEATSPSNSKERATIANELRTLPHHWSSGETVRELAYPDLLPDLAGRACRLFEADLGTIGQDRGIQP